MIKKILFYSTLCISSFIVSLLNIIQKKLPINAMIIGATVAVIFSFITYSFLNLSTKLFYRMNGEKQARKINKKKYFIIAALLFTILGVIEYVSNKLFNYAFIFGFGWSIGSIVNELKEQLFEIEES